MLFTGSRSRQLCVLPSAQAPPRSLHRVYLALWHKRSPLVSAEFPFFPTRKSLSPVSTKSWRLRFLQETAKSRATSAQALPRGLHRVYLALYGIEASSCLC